MKPEIPLKGGLEQDCLSGWRRFVKFRPGTKKCARRKFNKRVRREAKRELRSDDSYQGD